MVPPLNIANTLLNIEQKLIAYQTLHENELGELWKILNDCKRMIVATCDENDSTNVSIEKNEELSPS